MDHEKAVNLKRQIIEKGVKQLLEEAQVPMRYHLKVVTKLKKALDNNEKQAKDHEDTVNSLHQHYQGELNGLGEQVAGHAATIDQIRADHTTTVQQYQAEIEHLKTLQRGEDGEDGQDAPPVDEEALVSKVLSKVPAPEKGDKGDKGDSMALDDIITAVVKRIQKGDVIHINNVKGAGGFIKDGIKYRFEELMHGGGSKSTGGSGYQQPTSGVVNGSNATFVWTTAPNVIVVDGIPKQKTNSDGTSNWTGTTTTILTVAPNYDVYATA